MRASGEGEDGQSAAPGCPADAHGALPRTVPECVEEFLYARQARKQSPHTLAAYRRDLDGVAAILAAQAGTAPDRLEIAQAGARPLRQAFAAYAAPRSAASVGRAWSVWNQFFTFLVADALAPGNPMGAVERPRAPHRSPKPLRGPDTPEQLLQAAAAPPDPARRRDPWPERDLAVLAVLLCAGLRSSELLGLTLASLDGRPGERYLRVHGKGGKDRTIPVEPELDEVLTVYLTSRTARQAGRAPGRNEPLFARRDGSAMGRGALQYLVGRAYREAAVATRVPQGALVHALRHTFATRLAEDGASAAEIMRVMGHASLTTSQNYIDVTAREERGAIRSNRTHQALRELNRHRTDG